MSSPPPLSENAANADSVSRAHVAAPPAPQGSSDPHGRNLAEAQVATRGNGDGQIEARSGNGNKTGLPSDGGVALGQPSIQNFTSVSTHNIVTHAQQPLAQEHSQAQPEKGGHTSLPAGEIPGTTAAASALPFCSSTPMVGTTSGAADPAPSTHGNGSPDKRDRAPVKQNGPSLLSQALAAARGISQPSSNGSNSNHAVSSIGGKSPSKTSSTPHNLTASQPHTRPNHDTSTRRLAKHQLNHRHEGLSPEQEEQPASRTPADPTMAAAAATLIPTGTPRTKLTKPATTMLPYRDSLSGPSSFDQSALANARDMLLDHRNFLDRSRGRAPASSEIDHAVLQSPLPHDDVAQTNPEDVSTPTNASFVDTGTQFTSSPPNIGIAIDPSTLQHRPKGPEHRSTAGAEKTEKMWSIGTGEGSEEDGQVEKSVAEAMAGVEPNARSRKASYSLRFFKEGLPVEEKSRRKDTKPIGREQLSPTVEERSTQLQTDLQITHDDDFKTPTEKTPLHSIGSRQLKSATREDANLTSVSQQAKDVDYFSFERNSSVTATPLSLKYRVDGTHIESAQHDHDKPVAKTKTVPAQIEVEDKPSRNEQLNAIPNDLEQRHGEVDTSEDAHEYGDGEGDDSGEEKISSAVFLPHQELTDCEVIETFERDIEGTGPRPRSLSQSKTRPWLVKADEPEPEIQEAVPEDTPHEHDTLKKADHDGGAEVTTRCRDRSPHPASQVLASGRLEVSPQKPPAALVSQDEHLHDHQNDTEEQLEAIELKPYKHQVGGHTTLWRFSRRAVCKQLNSRENEFYEIIEKNHRDLLTFLPR